MLIRERVFSGYSGFTLVEVIIAISLLGVAFLGLGGVVPALIGSTATARVDFLAINAVDDRLETILMDPRYLALDSIYVEEGSAIAYLPGARRSTQIARVVQDTENGRTLDFTNVTVTVETQAPERTFTRRVVVAAP